MFQKTSPLGQQMDTAGWIPIAGKASEATVVPKPHRRVTEAKAGAPALT